MSIAGSLLRRLLQLSVLIVCGVGLAAAMVGYLIYSEQHWVPPARWIVFAAGTVVTFVGLARQFKSGWSRKPFWLTMFLFFTIHTIGYAVVLSRVTEWRLTWFPLLMLAEFIGMYSILGSLGYEWTRHPDQRAPRA